MDESRAVDDEKDDYVGGDALWAPERPSGDAPRRKSQKTDEWVVTRIRGTSSGVYYCINTSPRVMVKHSTRFDSFVCLSCRVGDRAPKTAHNTCPHNKFVRKYVESNSCQEDENHY